MGRSLEEIFGVTPGKHVPDLPPPMFRPEVPLLHPERNTDPLWQRKPWRKGGVVEMLRRSGKLDQAKLDAHFAACERRGVPGPTDTAVRASLATGVGTPDQRVRSTPNPPPSLGSHPQADTLG
jgi:hypothetical protein